LRKIIFIPQGKSLRKTIRLDRSIFINSVSQRNQGCHFPQKGQKCLFETVTYK
jgi:hypothetical protein